MKIGNIAQCKKLDFGLSIAYLYKKKAGIVKNPKIMQNIETKNKEFSYIASKEQKLTILVFIILELIFLFIAPEIFAQDASMKTLGGHSKTVNKVKFNPNGKYLVSVSNDAKAIIWNYKIGKIHKKVKVQSEAIKGLTFSKNGNYFFIASKDNSIIRCSANAGNVNKTYGSFGHDFISYNDYCTDLKISPNERKLYTANSDGYIKIWNISKEYIEKEIKAHSRKITAIEFCPASKVFATSSIDKSIKLWNLDNNTLITRKTGHRNQITDLKFSPDGKYLATASLDKTIKLRDAYNGEIIFSFEGHKAAINQIVFSPDGKYLVSASSDKTLKIWDLDKKKEIETLNGHNGEIKTVDFSPDGKFLASGSDDNTVKIWKVDYLNISPIRVDFNKPIVKVISPASQKIPVKKADFHIKVEIVSAYSLKKIQVFLNDEVIFSKKITEKQFVLNHIVKLKKGINKIYFTARNSKGEMRSKTYSVNFLDVNNPILYILSIGIDKYEDESLNLQYSAQDSDAITKAYQKMEGKLFSDVKAITLNGKQATRANIIHSLNRIEKDATLKDMILVFISSHGIVNHRKQFYLLPTDYDSKKNPEATGIGFSDLVKNISAANCKKVIFLDACNSGNTAYELNFNNENQTNNSWKSLLKELDGITLIASSSRYENSYEHSDWGHGAFTKAILEAFSGAADTNNNQYISLAELNLFITQKVKELTQGVQNAYMPLNQFGDIPIYKVSEEN